MLRDSITAFLVYAGHTPRLKLRHTSLPPVGHGLAAAIAGIGENLIGKRPLVGGDPERNPSSQANQSAALA